MKIQPNSIPQQAFLSSQADITIYGGAAGGGKTYGLLLSPLRHCLGEYANRNFSAVIFRRTLPEITNPGGMWDEGCNLYLGLGAEPVSHPHPRFLFPTGAVIRFAGLQYDKDLYDWDGSQIPLIGFDQLEHFSKQQFFYLLSRNRSTSGIPPYILATCNPNPDSWLRKFLGWWIDEQSGYAIPERGGVVRYFVRIRDDIVWAETAQELLDKYTHIPYVKSVTFIPSKVYDNKSLLEKDPAYLGNLYALPIVEQERLLHGNWNIRPAPGLYAKREWFKIVDVAPAATQWVRRWDLAGTEKTDANDPDWTVGVKLGKLDNGQYIVASVIRVQADPFEVRQAILNTASVDGRDCRVIIPQDPGQAGKYQQRDFVSMLGAYTVDSQIETGDKITRFGPFSSQLRAGNILLQRGPWNESYISALESFPDSGRDEADASSGALMAYTDGNTGMLEYYAGLAAQALKARLAIT